MVSHQIMKNKVGLLAAFGKWGLGSTKSQFCAPYQAPWEVALY